MESGRVPGSVHVTQGYQPEYQKPVIGHHGQYSVQAHPDISTRMPVPTGQHAESKALTQTDWKIEKNTTEDDTFGLHEKIFLCLEISKEDEANFRAMSKEDRASLMADFKDHMTRREWKERVHHGIPPSLSSDERASSASLSVTPPSLGLSGSGLQFGIDSPDLSLRGPEFGLEGAGGTKGKKGWFKNLKFPSFNAKKKAEKALRDRIAAKLKSGQELNTEERDYLDSLGAKDRTKFQKSYRLSDSQLGLDLDPWGINVSSDKSGGASAGVGIKTPSVEASGPSLDIDGPKVAKGKRAKIKNGMKKFRNKLFNFFVGKPVTKFVKWGSRFGFKHLSSWNDKNRKNLEDASLELAKIRSGEGHENDIMTPDKMGRMDAMLSLDETQVSDMVQQSSVMTTNNPELVEELRAKIPSPPPIAVDDRESTDSDYGSLSGGLEVDPDDLNINGSGSRASTPDSGVGIDFQAPHVDIQGAKKSSMNPFAKLKSKVSGIKLSRFGRGKAGKQDTDLAGLSGSFSAPGISGVAGSYGVNSPELQGHIGGADIQSSSMSMSTGTQPIYASHVMQHAGIRRDQDTLDSEATSRVYEALIALGPKQNSEQISRHTQMVQQALLTEDMAYSEDGKVKLRDFERSKAVMVIGWAAFASKDPSLMDHHYRAITNYRQEKLV